MLGLVGGHEPPADRGELGAVAAHDAVTHEHHLVGGYVVEVAAAAVEPPHWHRRGEARELALPVAQE